MTIAQYSCRYGKEIETVLKWIYDGLIPMASVDNDYIPDSAREPYRTKAKKADSIYKSIVKACVDQKHVCPKTYKICDDEFYGYINQLVDAGLIVKRETDNVTYYDATVLVLKGNKKFIIDSIKAISYGISLGVTTAVINAN